MNAAKMRGMKDALLEEGVKVQQGNAAARVEMLAQWEKESPDAARVHQLVDERLDAVRALVHRAAESALELHALLTPAQRAKVAEHVKERMAD